MRFSIATTGINTVSNALSSFVGRFTQREGREAVEDALKDILRDAQAAIPQGPGLDELGHGRPHLRNSLVTSVEVRATQVTGRLTARPEMIRFLGYYDNPSVSHPITIVRKSVLSDISGVQTGYKPGPARTYGTHFRHHGLHGAGLLDRIADKHTKTVVTSVERALIRVGNI